jgi:uncharacterized protein with FMN-binding domain
MVRRRDKDDFREKKRNGEIGNGRRRRDGQRKKNRIPTRTRRSGNTDPHRDTYSRAACLEPVRATGFMPGLTVQITVKNGAIKSVDIVSQNETPRWFSRVSSVIPGRVVNAQSTDVDSVSGATCSGEGILSAVENALAKAKK